ncbi:hypothetical protein IHQ71_06095 [Rhizobium sp. TH2]|uniref:hypothetical protein n=1 Tax=Rhizobium sp. TH2 TaxID=2775403 RepID=UPI00215854A5|nr:hypothetical protein [Rhizobium sp. TH2]UVC10174.1 hypothetical protein IHQ71_06095 [Rhizobium sp. TH2]
MKYAREKQVSSLRSFVDGAFWTTIVFLTVFMLLDFKLSEAAWIGMLGSIVVAIFTIAAAWFALAGSRAQINQNYDLEEERRLNSLIAARAVLPAILSEMITAAQNNIRLSFEPGHGPIGSKLPDATFFMPIPTDLIPPYKQCIEHADPCSQERLANVLRYFQVEQARHRSREIQQLQPALQKVAYTVQMHDAISSAIGWAVIHALIGDIFKYARGSQPSIPMSLDANKVREAFLLAEITLEMYPNLVEILEGRINAGSIERNWASG